MTLPPLRVVTHTLTLELTEVERDGRTRWVGRCPELGLEVDAKESGDIRSGRYWLLCRVMDKLEAEDHRLGFDRPAVEVTP